MSKPKIVKETEDKIHAPAFNIAAGDLANEMGKVYSKRVIEAIEDHAQFNLDIIYILVETKRHSSNWKEVQLIITVFPKDKKLNRMYESMDYFEYNYKTDKLILLWSIPERGAMKTFLRNPDKYSPYLLAWIRQYIKENNLDLNQQAVKVTKI